MRRADLPPALRAQVDAEVAHQDGLTSLTATPSPRTRSHGRTGGYRSKAEADYAAWLSTWANVAWRYERLTVGLPGARTRYTPDFTCRWTGVAVEDGSGIFPPFDRYAVEVKGTRDGEPYWREGARRRALDGAAELWDALRIPLFVAWKVAGAWKHRRVEVRS